jgi:HEAT repeat protein
MSLRSASPCLALTALLAGVLFLFPAAAHAEGTTIAQVVKQLDTSLKSKETQAVTTGLESVVEAYKTAEKADRKKLLSAVGKVLRKKDAKLKRAALSAFEAMGDADAWKYYGSLLRAPVHKSFSQVQSQAMDVTRVLQPEGAIKPLLKIMRKSKNLGAAAKALRTLGAFKNSKRRAKILDELISVTIKERPGVRGRDNTVWYGPRQTGEQARSRWQALSRPMVAAANELTGQELGSPEAWFEIWRDHRRHLEGLFQDE